MQNDQDEIEIDLLEVLFQLRRKIWIILLVAIAGALLVGTFTKFGITPEYSSTSKLYILSKSTSLTSLADIQIGTSLTKDYVELIQSRPVIDKVIENLNLNRTYEEVLNQVDITNKSDTRILVITATDQDPELAKDLADELAHVSKTQIAEIMRIDEPSIVELGYITGEPVNVHLLKNTALGGFAGAFVAIAIILVIYLLDDSVKTQEDVEKYLGINTLAAIPSKDMDTKKRKKK